MYAVCFDIGGTSVKYACVDEAYTMHEKSAFETSKDLNTLLCAIQEKVHYFQTKYPLYGMAVSCAGAFVKDKIWADNLNFEGVPLKQLLTDLLKMPVIVQNDGELAMLKEMHDGQLKGAKNAIYLTLGTGIGGSVICNGEVLYGAHHAALSVGHIITHKDGVMCNCGQRGCFECYASASALKKMSGMDTKEVMQCVQNGQSVPAFDAYIEELSTGILSLISLFIPEVVVLGGGLSNAGQILADSVNKYLRTVKSYQRFYTHCTVKIGTYKNDAGLLGAATRMFSCIQKENVI